MFWGVGELFSNGTGKDDELLLDEVETAVVEDDEADW